jgi:hypothetical protein
VGFIAAQPSLTRHIPETKTREWEPDALEHAPAKNCPDMVALLRREVSIPESPNLQLRDHGDKAREKCGEVSSADQSKPETHFKGGAEDGTLALRFSPF